MFKKHINIKEVSTFINECSTETKVYLGCDSERFRLQGVWYVDYITAVVVHIDGKHGCKIFGAVEREREYGDAKANKPKMRLMGEVYRVADLYLALSTEIAHDIEVHLDLNPQAQYGSSVAVQEAVGYIKGMCNVVPMVKPNSFAASYVADQFKTFESRRRMA
jgi:predicted RNase H-related nuclease YkuK (DUF458 family)